MKRIATALILGAAISSAPAQVYFSGTNSSEHVVISTNNAFVPTNGMAVAAWVYLATGASGTPHAVFANYTFSGGTEYGFICYINGAMKPRFYANSFDHTVATALVENVWTHLCFLRSSPVDPMEPNENRIYVNGKRSLDSSGVAPWNQPSGGIGLYNFIGAAASPSFESPMKGYIADVMVWSNSYPSDVLIETLASGRRHIPQNLWAHWLAPGYADRAAIPSGTRVVDLLGNHDAFTSNTVYGGQVRMISDRGGMY